MKIDRTLLPVALALGYGCVSTPKPEEPALDTAALAQWLDGLVQDKGLPGATLAASFPDAQDVSLAAGRTSPGDTAPALPVNARMLAGSTGKTYFAACAIALQADGRIDLDDPVSKHLGDEPWFARVPNSGDVSLRDLLQHRSGIPEYVWDPEVAAAVGADMDRVWGHAELARLLEGRDPVGTPRSQFVYADANYVLAMLAIEKATGEDLYNYAREQFLEPLGLGDTFASDSRDLPGLTQGHVVLGAQLGAPPLMVGDDGRVQFNTQFEWAGGGYVASAGDLARWGRVLWSGQLIDETYLPDLLDSHPTPKGPGDRYGIATIVRDTDLGPAHGHDGFFPGYLTSVAWFPEHGFSVAVQVNTDDLRLLQGQLFDVVLLPAAERIAEAQKLTTAGN